MFLKKKQKKKKKHTHTKSWNFLKMLFYAKTYSFSDTLNL